MMSDEGWVKCIVVVWRRYLFFVLGELEGLNLFKLKFIVIWFLYVGRCLNNIMESIYYGSVLIVFGLLVLNYDVLCLLGIGGWLWNINEMKRILIRKLWLSN